LDLKIGAYYKNFTKYSPNDYCIIRITQEYDDRYFFEVIEVHSHWRYTNSSFHKFNPDEIFIELKAYGTPLYNVINT